MPHSVPANAHRRARLAVGCAVLPALLGCSQLAQELQSPEFAVAVLVKTPDATELDGKTTIPGVTTAAVFLAGINASQISGTSAASGAATPQDDAVISIQYTDTVTSTALSIPLTSVGNGEYTVTSLQSKLTFEPTMYTVVITRSGSTYNLLGTPPMPEQIMAFTPNSVLTNVDTTSGFTVTRVPANADTTMNPTAFVAMKALTGMGDSGTSPLDSSNTYTNAPTDALGFLQLVLQPAPTAWQASSFTIPASSFMPSTAYLITLTPLSTGTNPTSGGGASLFPGSTFLIGAAAAGVIGTK